ncbi:MAG: winged helix-turn-helix domain-containing protein [Planctomycetota bacterium]
MAKKTTTKKATSKATTKKATTRKPQAKKAPAKKAPAKKTPRMSASAARAEGAAKTKRALADAKASVDANLKAIAAADQENASKRDQRAASKDGMTPSERAMSENAAPAKAAAKRRKQDGGKDPVAKIAAKADRKPSGLDLAAKVLADAGEPLKAKQIAERAIAAGWKTNGKTPEATLYAAMTREIARKGEAARFRKADRGLFEAGPKTKKGA